MIQIDMPMPNVCDDCPFMDENHGDYPYCIVLGQNRGYTFRIREKRFPNCPLKPVEEKKEDAEQIIALLKEQEAKMVIRCKDCKHRPVKPDDYENGFSLEFPDNRCPCQCSDGWYSWYPNDDWYCANGELR